MRWQWDATRTDRFLRRSFLLSSSDGSRSSASSFSSSTTRRCVTYALMTEGSRTISVSQRPAMRRLMRSVLALPPFLALVTLPPSSRSTEPARLIGVPARPDGPGVPAVDPGVSTADAATLLFAFFSAARRPRCRSSSSSVRSGSRGFCSESH